VSGELGKDPLAFCRCNLILWIGCWN